MDRANNGADKGFTLIEILVVICVLCCLGGLVFVATSEIHEDTIDATCAADRRAVEGAVDRFSVTEGLSKLPSDDPMGALVEAGVLREPSDLHRVGADGHVFGVGDCFSGESQQMMLMRESRLTEPTGPADSDDGVGRTDD